MLDDLATQLRCPPPSSSLFPPPSRTFESHKPHMRDAHVRAITEWMRADGMTPNDFVYHGANPCVEVLPSKRVISNLFSVSKRSLLLYHSRTIMEEEGFRPHFRGTPQQTPSKTGYEYIVGAYNRSPLDDYQRSGFCFAFQNISDEIVTCNDSSQVHRCYYGDGQKGRVPICLFFKGFSVTFKDKTAASLTLLDDNMRAVIHPNCSDTHPLKGFRIVHETSVWYVYGLRDEPADIEKASSA